MNTVLAMLLLLLLLLLQLENYCVLRTKPRCAPPPVDKWRGRQLTREIDTCLYTSFFVGLTTTMAIIECVCSVASIVYLAVESRRLKCSATAARCVS